MCVLEKLNFKISRGSMSLDPPSELAPPVLDPLFSRINSELLPPVLYCSDAENGKECQIEID